MSTIDLRSDTVTAPDAKMRAAMAAAPVGDDVFGDDPTVNELQRRFAALCNKEASLYVPTGTQGNLICAIVHGKSMPLSEIIMGDRAHTYNWEAGGAAISGGIPIRALRNDPDGTIPLDLLRANIKGTEDVHSSPTSAIFLENTHNAMSGRVLPMAYTESVQELCKQRSIKLHCDGARVWNAAAVLGLPVADVLRPFDTASVCLSKALGAPVGSMIVGSADFIATARRVRKMLGGGMRQCGIIAAGAIYALDNLHKRIPEDHAMATRLYEGVTTRAGLTATAPESNIFVFNASDTDEGRDSFVSRCSERGLRMIAWVGKGSVRAIPHYGNSIEDMDRAIDIIAEEAARK